MVIKRFFIEGIDFIKQLYYNRELIRELTKRNIKLNYVDNIFGLAWALFEPLAMMLILWFVFTYIRRSQYSEVPFAIYLLTGLIAYDFFNKTIHQATSSIKSFSFLIKKVNFRIAILPLVSVFSELFIHFIIYIIVFIILTANKIYPSVYWIQLLYYLFSACILLIGISWVTSSVSLFFPDISYIITIIMRVVFFLTPLFWKLTIFPKEIARILILNPLYYIVNGYRDSLLYHKPFWDYPLLTLTFWGITFFFLFLGFFIFRRLRPHFADVI